MWLTQNFIFIGNRLSDVSIFSCRKFTPPPPFFLVFLPDVEIFTFAPPPKKKKKINK